MASSNGEKFFAFLEINHFSLREETQLLATPGLLWTSLQTWGKQQGIVQIVDRIVSLPPTHPQCHLQNSGWPGLDSSSAPRNIFQEMRLQKPQPESFLQPGSPIHGPGQVAASCQLNLWEHDDHIHKRSGRTNEACVPWSGEGSAGRRAVDLPHRGRPLFQSIQFIDRGCPTLPIP